MNMVRKYWPLALIIAAASALPTLSRAQPGIPFVWTMHRANWTSAPRTEQIEAAKPSTPSRGVATLKCGVSADGSLTHCNITAQPANTGFEDAARRLVPLYRLDEAGVALMRGSGFVSFSIGWSGTEGCFPPYCTIIPPPPPAAPREADAHVR